MGSIPSCLLYYKNEYSYNNRLCLDFNPDEFDSIVESPNIKRGSQNKKFWAD